MYVGVDIGLKGAIVALAVDGSLAGQYMMPVVGTYSAPRRVDRVAVKALVASLAAARPRVAIEAPQQRRIHCERCGIRQGFDLASIKMQSHAEIWRTAFWGHTRSWDEVQPRSWRAILKGYMRSPRPHRAEWKAAAISYSKILYPALDLTPGKIRVPHDGIAEAALIATWLRSKALGEGIYSVASNATGNK